MFHAVPYIDSDSEDEGTLKTKTEKNKVDPTEMTTGEDEQEALKEEDDEEVAEEEDFDVSQQMEMDGGELSSESSERQTLTASMSNRSESKPYSSVTHKCKVRSVCVCVCVQANKSVFVTN